jgi:hypothetical protein
MPIDRAPVSFRFSLTRPLRPGTIVGVKTKGRRVAIAAGTVALVVLALAFWPAAKPVPPPVPVPNGYDDLLRAAALAPQDPFDEKEAGIEELRARLALGREALALARKGMAKECRVPLEYSADFIVRHVTDGFAFRCLGHLFLREAYLALEEERHRDALRSCLDAARLGWNVRQGGLLVIDYFDGDTIESAGTGYLRKILCDLTSITSQDLREAVRELERLGEEEESFDEVFIRETDFSRATSRPIARLWIRVVYAFQGVFSFEARYRSYWRKREVRSRLTLADLAIRAYRLDCKKWPDELEDLVPVYLKAVPLDPKTEKPLIYRVEGDSFILYGVGEDGRDDGGDREKDVLLDEE